jgi:hypothetical protein
MSQVAHTSLGGSKWRMPGSPHVQPFTLSASIFGDCCDKARMHRLAGIPGAGGQMPLDNCSFSTLFTWFAKRYGASWQLNIS